MMARAISLKDGSLKRHEAERARNVREEKTFFSEGDARVLGPKSLLVENARGDCQGILSVINGVVGRVPVDG